MEKPTIKKYKITRKNEGTWYNYFAVDKKGIIRKVGTKKEIKEFIKPPHHGKDE